MTKPMIFVFGASGTAGGHLLQALLPDHRRGALRLIAGVRRPEAGEALRALGAEVRVLDLDRAELEGLGPVLASLEGVERLFLVTGYTVKMLAQSKAVVDAAKAVGVSHIVHVGAYAAPDATSPHLGWHQLVEAYIERSGMGFTHLQPNWFMQQLLSWGRPEDAAEGVLTHYIGDGRPSWVDAEDIAAVAAAILRDPAPHMGKAYPLATEAASVPEIVALISEVTGLAWRYQSEAPSVFVENALSKGGDVAYMSCGFGVFTRTARGEVRETSDTFETIEQVTGQAATSLRSFIEKHRATFTY